MKYVQMYVSNMCKAKYSGYQSTLGYDPKESEQAAALRAAKSYECSVSVQPLIAPPQFYQP